jgi:hypothetical protein
MGTNEPSAETRPSANLTDRKVAGLKPGDPEEWWDEKVPGFRIRISAKGKKTWFVMYRLAAGVIG